MTGVASKGDRWGRREEEAVSPVTWTGASGTGRTEPLSKPRRRAGPRRADRGKVAS